MIVPNIFPVFWIFAFFVRFSLIFIAFYTALSLTKILCIYLVFIVAWKRISNDVVLFQCCRSELTNNEEKKSYLMLNYSIINITNFFHTFSITSKIIWNNKWTCPSHPFDYYYFFHNILHYYIDSML